MAATADEKLFLLDPSHKLKALEGRAPAGAFEFALGLLGIALAYVLCCVLIKAGLSSLLECKALRDRGVRTSAEVLSAEYHADSESSWYELTFRYAISEGTWLTGTSPADTPEAQTLAVRYLPDQPEIVRLEQNLSGWSLAGDVFGLLLLTLGFGGVVAATPWGFSALLLSYRGKLLRGTLQSATSFVSGEDDTRYHLIYSFIAPEGARLEGTAVEVCSAVVPQPGMAVAVLYRNPESFRLL